MTHHPVSLTGSLSRLNKILMLDRREIGVAYFFAILAGLVQLSLPLGIQSIINFVMAGSISTSIVVLIALVVVGVFVNGLLQVKQLEIMEKVQQKMFVRFSLEYADRIPRLNIEKLDSDYLPELVNRYFDSVSLQKGIDKIMIDLPAAIIQVLLGLLLLAFYHPIFIAFGVLLLLIVFTIIRYTSPGGLQTAMRASTYKYEVAAWLQEVARTIKTFKYTKGTSLHINKTDGLVSEYLDSRTKHFKILLTQFWSLISFKVIITAAMLILGSYLLVNQQINVGQFIAADIVIIAIIASIEKIITNLDAVYDALVSVEKLAVITDADVESSGSLELPDKNEGVAVEFRNISFAYGDQKPVLVDAGLTIAAGEMVQIKGPSGAGKSTLLRLLTGAFSNYKGEILLDGIPVSNYKVESIRNRTGILLGSQDIFQDSLWNNLTMNNPAITLEDVSQLADITGLQTFIRSSRNGYDSLLMPFGNKLSAKVRKNVLLIRALSGNNRLLLLDEPFEHLPAKNKIAVLNHLRRHRNTTILIASNDDDLGVACDRVFNL